MLHYLARPAPSSKGVKGKRYKTDEKIVGTSKSNYEMKKGEIWPLQRLSVEGYNESLALQRLNE
jgi:hypothetical protein